MRRKLNPDLLLTDEWWGCTRKVAYRTQGIAQTSAYRQSKLSKGTIKPYPCNYCNRWHIGHPPKTRRTKR